MFLSGVDPEVDTNAVLNYLKGLGLQGSTDFVCEKLNSKTNTYTRSFFKVGVPFEFADDLMHPNLWPQGCIVGKYAPRNRFTKRFSDGQEKHFLDSTRQTEVQS